MRVWIVRNGTRVLGGEIGLLRAEVNERSITSIFIANSMYSLLSWNGRAFGAVQTSSRLLKVSQPSTSAFGHVS